MPKRDFTRNHIIYATQRLLGMSQRQAYLLAFPEHKRWKSNSIDKQAHLLEKKPEVQAKMEELKQAAEAMATVEGIMSLTQLQKFCTDVLLDKITDKRTISVKGKTVTVTPEVIRANVKAKYADMLFKSHGGYKEVIQLENAPNITIDVPKPEKAED